MKPWISYKFVSDIKLLFFSVIYLVGPYVVGPTKTSSGLDFSPKAILCQPLIYLMKIWTKVYFISTKDSLDWWILNLTNCIFSLSFVWSDLTFCLSAVILSLNYLEPCRTQNWLCLWLKFQEHCLFIIYSLGTLSWDY